MHLVIIGVITPLNRAVTSVTNLFSAIYRSYFTPFVPGSGPPCRNDESYIYGQQRTARVIVRKYCEASSSQPPLFSCHHVGMLL